MIDPEEREKIIADLVSVREEMSIQGKALPKPSPSWRDDLLLYKKETPPAFHTIPDYHRALIFFELHRPKLDDMSKN